MTVSNAWIVDGVRTPFGRYGGALASVRTDDLAAIPIRALMERHAGLDWGALDDVTLGCANQAGEDRRNVARMALHGKCVSPGIGARWVSTPRNLPPSTDQPREHAGGAAVGAVGDVGR